MSENNDSLQMLLDVCNQQQDLVQNQKTNVNTVTIVHQNNAVCKGELNQSVLNNTSRFKDIFNEGLLETLPEDDINDCNYDLSVNNNYDFDHICDNTYFQNKDDNIQLRNKKQTAEIDTKKI